MLQRATADAVKGDFTRSAVTLRGARYGFRVRSGEYFITESDLTGKEQEHRIDYTLGSRRIQHYLTTLPTGAIVALPPTWDVVRREWFPNVDIIRPDEDDRLVMQQWNKSCVGCHVSGQENGYNPVTHGYLTRWTDFGTSCERCHGPGAAHVQQYRGSAFAPGATAGQPSHDVGLPSRSALDGTRAKAGAGTQAAIVRPTRLAPQAATAVCAQCHSLRTAINPGYRAGDDYYDYFTPVLEYAPYVRPHASQDPPYWADGRPRRFSNDAIGLWQSACFLRGGATCTSCHADPHLPDIDKNPQLAPVASNALCVRCHQPIGEQLTAHTRHAAASTGSACVDCHMPKTVVSIKATMRDHTIGVPAPENTVKFGIPNGCTECHKDKPASWAVDRLNSWWPNGRRSRLVAQAEAFSAARAGRADAIDRLLAIGDDERYGPLTRANAIGYLGNYSEPRAVAAVLHAARAADPSIRITALAAMRQAGHDDPGSRTAVRAGLSDPKRAVRIASLLTIIGQGASDLTAGDLARYRFVAGEFSGWAGANQQDSDLQRLQGIVHLLAGAFDRAAAALEISADLDPAAPSVKFFLALARAGERRFDEARTLLQQVPKTDPYYGQAQDQLKKLR